MIATIIAWVLSHLSLIPWALAGIAGAVAVFFQGQNARNKVKAKEATKRLDTIEKVKRIKSDVKKTDDPDLADRLTRKP